MSTSIYPFGYSHTWSRTDRACLAPAGLRFGLCAASCSLDWLKKMRSTSRVRSDCVLPLVLAVPGGSRDVPGVVFGGRNGSFFVRRRCSDVSVAQNARSAFRMVKTISKRTSARARGTRQTLENRSADVLRAVRRRERVPGRLRSVSGASRARSWSVPGRSWGALGSPRASPEHLGSVPGASSARPRTRPARPRSPKSAPEAIFEPFGLDVGGFGEPRAASRNDFRSAFSVDVGAFARDTIDRRAGNKT